MFPFSLRLKNERNHTISLFLVAQVLSGKTFKRKGGLTAPWLFLRQMSGERSREVKASEETLFVSIHGTELYNFVCLKRCLFPAFPRFTRGGKVSHAMDR